MTTPPSPQTPDEAIAALMAGNARYAENLATSTNPLVIAPTAVIISIISVVTPSARRAGAHVARDAR